MELTRSGLGYYGAVRLLFFFFQAEDGIRDLIVTGVQTCALPISHERGARGIECLRAVGPLVEVHRRLLGGGDRLPRPRHPAQVERSGELVAPDRKSVV